MEPNRFLSNSAISLYATCPRAYQYRYVQGIGPATESVALTTGTDYHEAIAHPPADGRPPRTIGEALAIGHHAWRKRAAVEIAFEECEVPWEIALGDGRTLRGVWDGFATFGGRRYLVEHKTASTVDEEYWQRLLIDQQVTIYMLAARAKSLDVAGVIYTVCRKPKLRPKSLKSKEFEPFMATGIYCGFSADRPPADSPPSEETEQMHINRLAQYALDPNTGMFDYRIVVRTEQEMADGLDDLEYWIKRIQDDKAFGRNVGSCFKWGKACDYFRLCTGQASRENPLASGYVQLTIGRELVKGLDANA